MGHGGSPVDKSPTRKDVRWKTRLPGGPPFRSVFVAPEGVERLLVAAMTSMHTQREGSFGCFLLPAPLPSPRRTLCGPQFPAQPGVGFRLSRTDSAARIRRQRSIDAIAAAWLCRGRGPRPARKAVEAAPWRVGAPPRRVVVPRWRREASKRPEGPALLSAWLSGRVSALPRPIHCRDTGSAGRAVG